MSDELVLAGKTYVASKRAAAESGYAQDYVGQLARGGLIDAQRVGGLWYVAVESLRAYKENAEAIKPQPPIAPSASHDPETIVNFDGKDYISASRASKLTGYNQDYVGQLARSGKILSRQIGKRWYVEREGLLEHKREKDALLAAVQKEAVGLADTPQAQILDTSITEMAQMTYFAESGDLIPSPIRTQSTDGELKHAAATPVPIHVVRPSKHPHEHHFKKIDHGVRQSRKTKHGALKSIAAVFILIMLASSGIVLTGERLEGSIGQIANVTKVSAMTAALAGSLDSIGSVLEEILVPELVYERKS